MALPPEPVYTSILNSHPYIGPLMINALECLCNNVSAIPNPPAICCFRVGTEIIHDAGFSIDQCCEGIAYVALGDAFPSSQSFPEQDIVRQSESQCKPPTWGLYLKVGLIRCIPVGGIEPLDCAGWNAAALQNIYDTTALLRTSCCIRDYVIHQEARFLGMSAVIDRHVQGNPLGGCIERSFTMPIQIPNCEC